MWGVLLLATAVLGQDYSEKAAEEFLATYNKESGEKATVAANAEWDYESNITPETLKNKLSVSVEQAKWRKKKWEETIKYPWTTYKDENIRRQFKSASILGMAALPEEKFKRLEEVIAKMESIYSTAKICDYKNKTNCNLSLEPEITEILRTSRDPEEMKHIWVEWHKASGSKCRELYQEYVKLSNEGAKLNNMSDLAELWNYDFESDHFQDEVLELWSQVEPLYKQLHAYMRRKLWEKYGDKVVSRTGPIPAHLLGNMWAQTWSNTFDFTAPHLNKDTLDVTNEMIKQNYTALKMFKVAEDFFTSLNLSAMPPMFWEKSIIEKPEGRELVCHASAWDFYDGKDFRVIRPVLVGEVELSNGSTLTCAIPWGGEMSVVELLCNIHIVLVLGKNVNSKIRIKMCTRVEMDDLLTVHHEMGHIQYYIQYKDQPYVYKEGANSGFHEAVGDVIFLSAATRKHLQRLELLHGNAVDDPEQELNSLYQRALDKIAFLPFGLLVDLYRWNIFKGTTTPATYNRDWWTLREKYQGVEPPVDRGETDFDPAAKYHVVGSVPYIRYFVSFIIQFQFHRALCIEAGEFDPQKPEANPLHECSIYNSTKAGNLLGKMLQMGSSRPWPEAMEVLTGQRKMDGTALIQFFQPLYDWLKDQNEKTGEKIGWDPSKRTVSLLSVTHEQSSPAKNETQASPSGAPIAATLSPALLSIFCILSYFMC